MGHGSWSEDKWTAYAATTSTRSVDKIYTRSSNTDEYKSGQNLDPSKIQFRESRDSTEHPKSTPIIIGLDVTGSMGFIAEDMAKRSLGKMVESILQRKPVTDPHFLFMGIGDAIARDRAPLQVTQFEADNTIIAQLTDIWLEGHGGGNSYEGYDLAWIFAAHKIKTDAWDKRQVKGYIFTIGDEEFPNESCVDYIKSILNNSSFQGTSPVDSLKEASERFHIFHIIVAQGDYASAHLDNVQKSWKEHLGLRALTLTDHNYITEVIASAISISEGQDVETVINSWPTDVAEVVRIAISGNKG